MMSVYVPPYGECTNCGKVHKLSTGKHDKKQTDFGEEFGKRYCCGNCLSEHGPTKHVRVRHNEVTA